MNLYPVGVTISPTHPSAVAAIMWMEPLVAYTLFMMQYYLTDVWGLSFTHAAAILNIWGGISKISAVFFLFAADALLTNILIVMIAFIPYNMGMGFVVMSTPPVLANLSGTCKEYEARCIGPTQEVVFYTGMALLAVGVGIHHASLNPFLREQNVKSHLSFKAYHYIYLFSASMIITSFPRQKQYWLRVFGASGLTMFISTILYCTKCCGFEVVNSQDSPLSDVCRVFVAAALKITHPVPKDTNELYKEGDDSYSFPPSRFLWWLENAAIILPGASEEDQARNRWRLCSVQQVEAAKFVVRIIPIGTTFIICAIVSSVGNTFLVEQGSHMNRNLGKWKVPPVILLGLFFLAKKLIFGKLADCLMQRSRKYGPPIGIALAIVCSSLCCVSASLIEIERLKIVKHRGLLNEATPMAASWLFFPFFLLAGLDSFFKKSAVSFFENESPNAAMKRYCGCFTEAVSGLGLIYSVISVLVVGKITEIGGRQSWFQSSLNKSRLDLYYWALAALGALNLLMFIPLASLYKYKDPVTNEQAVVVTTT